MSKTISSQSQRPISRRNFLRFGGGALAVAAGAYLVPRAVSAAVEAAQSAAPSTPNVDANGNISYHLAATDGWIYLPPKNTVYHPDPWAPAPFNTYTFGFRDVTGLSDADVRAQKGLVQASAPLLYAQEGKEARITLTNLGFSTRPDLTDGHTIHFHGFPNAIPAFDGVPELSMGVPSGRSYTYFYKPHDPGTYMYHCHFEDVEHVSMGMTGIVFVRPIMGANYAYNDASTRFDHEYPMFLSELWTLERWEAAHIQEHDWSDYDPDYWLINGRSYPDTLAPDGDPLVTPARPELQYQPMSSLVTCSPGQRVLLRFVNLGFQQHAMRADGITFDVVGKDAKFLGPTAAVANPPTPAYPERRYQTDTILVGPGESIDAIFTAPAAGTYRLYNRKLAYLNNGGTPNGGMMTEIRVA
jgi:FtsP/CotA-like multicopper oxidase with cupredoxin domain